MRTQFDTSSGLVPGLFLIEGLFFWLHALVKYARYQDPPRFLSMKHHMTAMFHAAQGLSPKEATYQSPGQRPGNQATNTPASPEGAGQ